MWKWFSESSSSEAYTSGVPSVRNNQSLIKAVHLRDAGFQMGSHLNKFEDREKDLGSSILTMFENKSSLPHSSKTYKTSMSFGQQLSNCHSKNES